MADRKNRLRVTGYRPLREKVLKRDDYTCRLCGESKEDGAVLEVDHIVRDADEGESVEENLITLCRTCHGEKTRRENTKEGNFIPQSSERWY